MPYIGIQAKRLVLVLGDFAVFQIALALTLFIRYGHITEWNIHALPFSILGILWVISFYVAGLYDLSLTRDSLAFLRLFLEDMAVNLGIALAFFYLLPIFGIAPRTNLILHFAIVLLLGYAWRLFFNRLIAPALFRNRALYIGPADKATKLTELLQDSALGFEIRIVAETLPGARSNDPSIMWTDDLAALPALIKQHGIQTIIVSENLEHDPRVQNVLYSALFESITIMDQSALEETVTGRIPLEYVSQAWFLRHLRENEKAWYEGLKRIADIVLAIPFGIITAIIFPIVGLLIKLSSPGPILYSQNRVGKHGELFRIWKFRSMRTDAERAGPQFTASAKTDPRLTSIGRTLRRLRIDELPQIWNVLRGDLSFIGPRPERPEFVAPLIERMPQYALRHLTRPGLTGWAQVRLLTPTATLEDNLTKLQYDLFYIKRRSLLLDVAILLKTIGIVLRRQGT